MAYGKVAMTGAQILARASANYAANKAFQYAKNRVSKKARQMANRIAGRTTLASTLRSRKMKRYSKSEQKGESAGFFSKKPKKDIFQKYTKSGVVSTREVGVLVVGQNNTQPIFIGHATHGNAYDITVLFCRAIVREIFNQSGVRIKDMENESPGTYIIEVRYCINSVFAADAVVTLTTTGLSYIGISDSIRNSLVTAQSTVGGLNEFYITTVKLTSGTTLLAQLDYQDTYVHVLAKSDLKIQNRTVATGTDEDVNSAENIANQPLYGKAYRGIGNGLVCKLDQGGAHAGKALVCSEFGSNVVAYATGTADFWLQEPPLPTLFTPYPKMSKASIEPGHVKTSSLIETWKCKQTDFWRLLSTTDADPRRNSRVQNKYGRFAIFALEKMLCVTAADSVPTVGAESNTRLGLMFTRPKAKMVAEVTEAHSFITAVNGPNV